MLKDEVRKADVIFCCTPSTASLFPAEYLTATEGRRKGRLVSAIGSYRPHMSELHLDILRQVVSPHHHNQHHKHATASAAVVVDSSVRLSQRRRRSHPGRPRPGTARPNWRADHAQETGSGLAVWAERPWPRRRVEQRRWRADGRQKEKHSSFSLPFHLPKSHSHSHTHAKARSPAIRRLFPGTPEGDRGDEQHRPETQDSAPSPSSSAPTPPSFFAPVQKQTSSGPGNENPAPPFSARNSTSNDNEHARPDVNDVHVTNHVHDEENVDDDVNSGPMRCLRKGTVIYKSVEVGVGLVDVVIDGAWSRWPTIEGSVPSLSISDALYGTVVVLCRQSLVVENGHGWQRLALTCHG